MSPPATSEPRAWPHGDSWRYCRDDRDAAASDVYARRRQSAVWAGRRYNCGVITRLWRGWTTPENADAYEQFLLTRLFPSMRANAGFRGADVLRRRDGQEIAFVTLTRFESIDAIRGFAGDDYEVAVLEPEAIALLSRYENRASHFVTASFVV
jgi:hypothetical protein